ncbi:MAG: flagellar motor switch protein FliG [Treponema sp.]|jgi:flagellar motor switch protein FliG|nr:flagellar motor switch protein FliG [Treponema sp.]
MGNILQQGIKAYKQTINQDHEKRKPQPENRKKAQNTRKPEFTEGLVKTSEIPAAKENKHIESKYRKAAKFLILIGGEQAADILAELDPKQIEEISKEIAIIKVIKPEEGDEILSEFKNLLSGSYRFSGLSHGGIETARRILYAAKGPEKGEALLNKAVPDSKENLFSFLEEFSPEQLAMLLKTETPQMAALVLSRLSPKLSAGTIGKLPPDRKPEILKRIAHQEKISPEVLEQVSAALKEKVRNVSGGAKDFEVDGMQALAAILKQGDYSFGDRIVNELEEKNPEIGKNLKEKLYTLDDIINTVDRPLEEKLKTMSDNDIAILLKGRGKDFHEKILSCVSAGRRKQIRDEYDIMGAIAKRDCDAAAGEFLTWFRHARENGEIILYSDEDVFI